MILCFFQQVRAICVYSRLRFYFRVVLNTQHDRRSFLFIFSSLTFSLDGGRLRRHSDGELMAGTLFDEPVRSTSHLLESDGLDWNVSPPFVIKWSSVPRATPILLSPDQWRARGDPWGKGYIGQGVSRQESNLSPLSLPAPDGWGKIVNHTNTHTHHTRKKIVLAYKCEE